VITRGSIRFDSYFAKSREDSDEIKVEREPSNVLVGEIAE
jgi:hypothetical protein